MCFELTVIGPADHSADLSIETPLYVRVERKWLDKRPYVKISEGGPGCACALLSDDADWSETSVILRSEVLPSLITTLKSLHADFSGHFEFEARWIGDPIKHKVAVTIDELFQVIENNDIAQFTRYRVGDFSPDD